MRAFVPLIGLVLLTGMRGLEIEVAKVEGTTAIHGSVTALLDVSFEDLRDLMCDFDVYSAFSSDDTIADQVLVQAAMAETLRSDPPRRLKKVRALMKPGLASPSCPGTNHVLHIQDFPWPLKDQWQLMLYQVELSDWRMRMDYESVAGMSRAAKGLWTLERVDDATTRLENRYTVDLGLRIPGFLIEMSVNRQLTSMFSGIEAMARERAPIYRRRRVRGKASSKSLASE